MVLFDASVNAVPKGQALSNEVVLSLHQLYQAAFSDLLVLVGLIIGFAGILLPVGIAALQARQQRKEALLARERIQTEVHEASSVLRRELLESQAASLAAFQERSDKVIADLRQEVSIGLERVKAQTLHVQALTSYLNSGYAFALTSACAAVPGYLAAKDYANLRTVCAQIIIKCLEGLDASRFDADAREKCDETVARLASANSDGNFTDLIRDMRKAIGSCTSRTSNKTPA